MLVVGGLLAALTALTSAASGEPPTLSGPELGAVIREAGERYVQGDPVGCLATLAPVRDAAWNDPVRGTDWIAMRAHCEFGSPSQPIANVPLEPIRALVEPWGERPALHVPPNPDAVVSFVYRYWRMLNHYGYRDTGDPILMSALNGWVERVRADPADVDADKALLAFAWATIGSWQLHDYTREFHELFRSRLGPAHRATLVMQRSLAYNERYLGRAQQAMAHIEEAVVLTDRHHADDAALRVAMRSERAACLSGVGRLAEALSDALMVRDAVLARPSASWTARVRSHYNLASIAAEMGDHRAAIAYADQSIAYARASGDPILLVEARVPAATREVSRLMLGEPGAAQDLKTALIPTDADEMHIGPQIFALVRHAAASGDTELLDWSSAFMRKHIRDYRTPFQPDRAVLDLMDAWQRAGAALQAPTARVPLERALAGSLTGRSFGMQALMHFNLARHLAATDPDTAVWLYKRGGNALQRLRRGLPAGDTELHRAWLSAHEPDLRAFIALLIDQGRLVEAEQAVMLLRDEEVNEYTRRSLGRRDAPTRGLSYTPLESTRDAGMEALAQRAALAATSADERADAWRTIGYKRAYRDDEADAALARLAGEVDELLAAAPASRGVSAPRRERAVAALPPGVARLTYFVRSDRLDLVLQDRGRYRKTSVAIERETLNRRVQKLRAAVGSPERDPRAASAELHALLIAPVGAWLRDAQVRHLQLVPDASLRYVPFAALHDGRHYLAQRYALSIDLSGSSARETPPAAARARAADTAAFGRSIGDADHAALPGVPRELLAVTRWQGTSALNEAFTADSLRARLETHPAVVHIASHFVIDPAGEDRSYLLTGDGQRLSLAALRQMPWGGVRLALLSACDSAVSVDAGHGRELIGFASALLGAGVNDVVASLWRVSDDATADWMARFYAHRHRAAAGDLGPATLARTQREWLRRYAGAPLAHPHYWAAFQWMSAR